MASFSGYENLSAPPQPHADVPQRSVAPKLLICVPSMSGDSLQTLVGNLAGVFSSDDVLVASPDFDQEQPGFLHRLPMTLYQGPRGRQGWVLTACDFLAASQQTEKHNAASVLMLGSDAAALPVSAVRRMADTLASGLDLAVPAYAAGPHDALVNSALLYPVTRALFAANVRFPLPMDVGMSRRMASRVASIAQRQNAASQPDSLLWPVAEAAVGGLSIRQVDSSARTPQAPEGSDFNTLFTGVAGALFADIEAKAAFWQRARTLSQAARTELPPASSGTAEDVSDELPGMVDAFRLAHNNLQEIWSLILPPQSLLALKKLSLTQPSNFSMAPALWARVVYDFMLAFRLRSMNRGHLLGVLTPLYLAWVASTLRMVTSEAAAAQHREETAAAFEREKPYLVARWRWPDRFNP
jgi:hypothetical protein